MAEDPTGTSLLLNRDGCRTFLPLDLKSWPVGSRGRTGDNSSWENGGSSFLRGLHSLGISWFIWLLLSEASVNLGRMIFSRSPRKRNINHPPWKTRAAEGYVFLSLHWPPCGFTFVVSFYTALFWLWFNRNLFRTNYKVPRRVQSCVFETFSPQHGWQAHRNYIMEFPSIYFIECISFIWHIFS